ncbi:MAG: hypothetical protein IH991_01510 [Planctomycetes bacterium]|nr:hypothetical protein [Planctomycetota bacterium]
MDGVRAGTRQELDLPLDVGPVRVVPYVLGDLTYWQEDVKGNDKLRLYGQTGVRATMPMWKADPTVQSELFNLNGLAHKVVFETEFFWADASQDLERRDSAGNILAGLPLYDPLDDDSQEHFRRRFVDDTFRGGINDFVPLPFDERFYALRSGMQSWVTAPSAEIADDLMIGRFAIRQRWQTKRGMPGEQRIIDWITFDVEGTFFPRAQRDNFGAKLGMWNYDFRWHVGDRLTFLSDGFFDFFNQGLRTVSIGSQLSRPEIGYLYVGFRTIEGPISSNVLSAALTYRMSEKWIATAGTSYDFSSTGNIGQSLAFTRIGESFLIRVGINSDISRGNVGAVLGIEPRFFPNNRLGMVAGVRVPPAGARGLE